MKKSDVIRGISLIVICLGIVIYVAAMLTGVTLPDAVVRILGIAGLVALALLSYTTVKKVKKD